jgi:hypothetical protein
VIRLTEFANLLDPREKILILGRRTAHAVYLRNVVLVLTLWQRYWKRGRRHAPTPWFASWPEIAKILP